MLINVSTTGPNGSNLSLDLVPMELTMDRFIHEQNLVNYRRLIAESNLAVTKDEVQHKWLLKLLADEVAKGATLLDRRH